MIFRLFRQIFITLQMIKFEHTVFALPFAFLGAILSARGMPAWDTCLWILLAMIGARSAAMAFNRLVDTRIDSLNPRTSRRALPAGLLHRGYVIAFIIINSVLLIYVSYRLNTLSLILSFPALAILFFYSYTKRFTSLSHLVLGFALSIAPAGGWIAVSGTFSWSVLILSGLVVTWVAGFDIIYACQDVQFDSVYGLYSIPRRFGVRGALRLSFLLHMLTVVILVYFFMHFALSWIALGGIILISTLLLIEHLLIKPDDLSRLNLAFFTLNGFFSVLLFVFVFLDLLVFSG